MALYRFQLPLLLCILFSLIMLSSSMDNTGERERTIVELAEYNLEEKCASKAEAAKKFYLNPASGIDDKILEEKVYAQDISAEIDTLLDYNASLFEPIMRRRLEFIDHIGDFRMEEHDRDTIIDYSNNIEKLILTEKIPCPNGTTDCKTNYEGILNVLAYTRDNEMLNKTWTSWEKKFESQKEDFIDVFKLLKKSAEANKFQNVTEYWEMLVEYPNAYDKMEKMWSEIKPFYVKLHKFMKERLIRSYSLASDINELPIHLLGSFHGDDWTNIFDIINPHPQFYNKLTESLQNKKLGGRRLYEATQVLMDKMGLGKFYELFWKESDFKNSCPSHLLSYCQKGNTEILTCDQVNVINYLEAHEMSMQITHEQLGSLNEDVNTYLLRYPERYSAVYEAVRGLGSTLALRRKQLHNTDLIPIRDYLQPELEQNGGLSLLLLNALRVFPRLAYYYTADKFRLETVADNDLGVEWWKLRKEHNLLSSNKNNEWDFLSDPLIAKNSPYIGKFLGTILQFQIVNHFERSVNDDKDLVEQIKEHNELRELMKSASVEPWPVLIRKHFDIEDISADFLLGYFEPLNDYMDNAPLEQVIFQTHEQTTTTVKTTEEYLTTVINKIHQRNSVHANKTVQSKIKSDTAEDNTTEANKNIANETAASVPYYVWICVGGLLILLILTPVIIACRKRTRQKKNLDIQKKCEPI